MKPMLKGDVMTARITLISILLLSVACGTPSTKDALTKAEAQALVEGGDADDTICTDNGFDEDGECDDWCPDGDELDCAVSNACTDGDTKDANDGCNTCSCVDGGWACTEIACDPNVDPGNNASTGPQMLEIGDCPEGGDMLTVDGVSIKDDVLQVDASFSGGCAEHTVTACWDGLFLESFPVQARISLYHDANGDACEAYLSQTFTYDLTPMKDSYLEGYQATEGTIILGVEDQGTEYTF